METARCHEEHLHQLKQPHAKDINVRKETSGGNAGSPINNLKVANADIVTISVEKTLIFARLEELFRTMQALNNANVEPSLSLMGAMKKVKMLFKCGRSINKIVCSVEILNLTREVHRLTRPVE